MDKGQRRAQEIVNRLLVVMSEAVIASRAGIDVSEVQAAQNGTASAHTVRALDQLGDDMDRDYGAQNR